MLYLKLLNHRKVFVDLAHISQKGFWDAVELHDRSQPLLVTHTGVSGVHPHWRNLDDRQLKAVAETAEVIRSRAGTARAADLIEALAR